MQGLRSCCIKRTDHDVIPVRIPKCNLHGSGARVLVRFLFKAGDERPCSWHRRVKIIDTEKQQQAVARLRVIRAHQGGMLMGAPLVQAEQDRAIRVSDLPEVVMRGLRFRLAK